MSKHGFVKKIVGDLSFLDSSPFAKLLDSCLKSKSLRDTRRIHARIIKTQFAYEVFIQNRLIDAYGKCGCFDDARKIFDQMPEKNVFSWNAIVSTLVKFGFLDEGARLFVSMPEPDQCSWNSLIAGFAQHDRFEEALNYFVKMHRKGFVLNEYTFGSGLSACAGLKDLKIGTQIHGLMLKSQFLLDVYMGSALIDIYSKCGFVDCAQRVFDGMMERNVVSWNSLITCYEQNGPSREALEIFMRMMESGFEPDEVTLASVVSACASLAAAKQGLEIHACVVKRDKLRDDLILSNALVDMYAKCGRTNEARCVFDRMPIRNVVSETSMVSGYAKTASVKAARLLFTKMIERNVVSWNALIAGYTQNGENEEALRLFRMLKREAICPTHYTFGNLLNACANLADLQLGRQAHAHVLKHGFRFQYGEESDVFVGNALIDMYMKCGSVEEGCRIFENMVERDYVSWNAMIVGYAQNGYGMEALGLFRKMLASGEKPDHVTMIGALCACSHAGLVQEGRKHFSSMTEEYGLVPSKDHYTCMVDLLGRAGCLNEAKDLIETMSVQPDAVVWGSLLGACKVHHNITLGEYVAEKLLEIDPMNSGPYVLLSNMYAELGRWKDVLRVRKLMKHRGVIKQPGCSWIEILGHVHIFMVKDKRHHQRKEIYLLLKMLTEQMRRAGYVLDANDHEEYKENNG
ncbi:pentatricopeptide repeat-containing protein At2g13600 [Ricinus communis]|uniref:pentatricopeptide repeat-containing protein At2g13600 n=1 Tax=Ricinus communis TaxID=3988 RepID=UPI00201AA1DA|nr:pentatricopeptide repeat-containing protein At2g13600 [Ricinus communis]XP_048234638.1 pentatricopeptide repeat-containing protein At2g13600 [Ricinus communis]XP_048234639.1 pentatricopeptide repeat-containing protein At2g13600 [Ricinus communis]XP_048234640.1 pentatricopeptide repeat-containing protein At2g13600 [Ricinus communis]